MHLGLRKVSCCEIYFVGEFFIRVSTLSVLELELRVSTEEEEKKLLQERLARLQVSMRD